MTNIDALTLGCEFKDDDGNIWKVSSNFSQINKLFVELTKVELVAEEKLLEE